MSRTPSGKGDNRVVRAAGALPWRYQQGRLQVAVVHRPRYDDWAWAKGKLDAGEDWPGAAVREVGEETGLRVRLGVPLPAATYRIRNGSTAWTGKEVRYWAAQVTGGSGTLDHEVDGIRWLTDTQATRVLTYRRDRDQLDALVALDRVGGLHTWPLILVRHAHAVPRKKWSGDDWLRPLSIRGERQADDLVDTLRAYDVRRLVSSTSTRCTRTLMPYAARSGLELDTSSLWSEEGYAERPEALEGALAEVMRTGVATALCTHGPVLPEILRQFATRVDPRVTLSPERTLRALRRSASTGMTKGEAMVLHLRGTGDDARVVAVEQHVPQR